MIENIESRKQKVVVLFEVTPTAEQFECRKQVVVIECMGK